VLDAQTQPPPTWQDAFLVQQAQMQPSKLNGSLNLGGFRHTLK